MNGIDKDEIARLTEEYGGQWGHNLTRRLLQLITIIGKGQHYDTEVVWIAAHLHDWGGYSKWIQPGVDHALRSRQVAESFWKEKDYPQEILPLILTCIETHHSGDPHRPLEAILLSDADMLDFLGVVGVLRDFSKKPNDLRRAYETVQNRMVKSAQVLCLEFSRQLAAQRKVRMQMLLANFEEESFGYF